MIVEPKNWESIGQAITLKQIEETLLQVIADLKCKNLSLSGGIDSSLMLYYMTRVFNVDEIKCYTMACGLEHPDRIYANEVAVHFGVNRTTYIPDNNLIQLEDDLPGDEIVRAFYTYLSSHGITEIIACDGIDEFMGGYYAHMKKPTEETYYKYLKGLQREQLEPLNKNSGKVEVFLPYISQSVIYLLSQIPLKRKFDETHRKKIMFYLAKGKLPTGILTRRKYGFCDAMRFKSD